jgi:glycosyltransferase involved in cell wall biosynthesis
MRVPEEKITVVGEALYDIYGPVSPDQAAIVRSKYGLEQDYILFVSVLYPYKNVETLIKCLAQIPGQKTAALKLAIVGRDFDGQQAKLQILARDLGVSDRVRFLGFVPVEDLPAIYCGARVFVFPSLVETFGKPLVEAMQCGVPVVASNTSCIPEVLGGAGLLVNPLNAIEMASAIAQAAEDCALRKELIERGFRRGQDFSWESGARQTLGIIERTFENWKTSQRHVQDLIQMPRK